MLGSCICRGFFSLFLHFVFVDFPLCSHEHAKTSKFLALSSRGLVRCEEPLPLLFDESNGRRETNSIHRHAQSSNPGTLVADTAFSSTSCSEGSFFPSVRSPGLTTASSGKNTAARTRTARAAWNVRTASRAARGNRQRETRQEGRGEGTNR
jgi:hypothetical protein